MDDEKIIALYRNRDEEAITATAEKYGGYCIGISYAILGNREDAEECTNDTYLRVWNTIPPQIPVILSAYLAKIVRNLSFNRYKAQTSEKRGGGQLPPVLDELADCIHGTETVEQTLSQKELGSAINGFLSTLSKEKRIMFVRRYFYGDSMAEIAVRLDRKEHTVTVALNRMRANLRAYLTERGF